MTEGHTERQCTNAHFQHDVEFASVQQRAIAQVDIRDSKIRRDASHCSVGS